MIAAQANENNLYSSVIIFIQLFVFTCSGFCYNTIQPDERVKNYLFNLFTLPYRVWSSIVIVHEKRGFFPSYNISKTAKTILIKKIGRNHSISIYKKPLISEHRKNYIFQDNNSFVKMSVSLLVITLSIFVDALAQKLV